MASDEKSLGWRAAFWKYGGSVDHGIKYTLSKTSFKITHKCGGGRSVDEETGCEMDERCEGWATGP